MRVSLGYNLNEVFRRFSRSYLTTGDGGEWALDMGVGGKLSLTGIAMGSDLGR